MKLLATLGFALCIAGVQCHAKTLDGRLMDADCYNQKKVQTKETGHKDYHSITKTCAATAATTDFAVRVLRGPMGQYEGETIKLDQQGNLLAAAAMQDGQLKTDSHGNVRVKIRGMVTDDEFMTTRSVSPRGILFL